MNIDFFEEINSTLDSQQIDQYNTYFQLINEYNKIMNLTGIDDYEGVYLKHFYDCLTIKDSIKNINPQSIADVGTGAGFPGIVLAIYFPTIKFHLIEPLTKRIKFLQKVVEKLELKNVTLINDRVENLNLIADVVTSRAVSQLNILLELCAPICKINGTIIALKGPKVLEEIDVSQNAIDKLGLKIEKNDKLILPIENSVRYNVYLKKIKETPNKYPRNFGQIKKKPL